MLHPDVELRYLHAEIGYGLIAKRFIPRGTITWAMCELEQVFSPAAYAKLPQAYRPYLEKYAYATSSGDHILCCDFGRYMNHSCEPNSLTLPDAEIEVAVRDILPGDQITDDYGTLNLEVDLHCLCGTPECRGVVRGDDLLRYQEQWESVAHSALAVAAGVDQPLAPFVPEGLEERIAALLKARDNVLGPSGVSG
jgi:hypothetical protein